LKICQARSCGTGGRRRVTVRRRLGNSACTPHDTAARSPPALVLRTPFHREPPTRGLANCSHLGDDALLPKYLRTCRLARCTTSPRALLETERRRQGCQPSGQNWGAVGWAEALFIQVLLLATPLCGAPRGTPYLCRCYLVPLPYLDGCRPLNAGLRPLASLLSPNPAVRRRGASRGVLASAAAGGGRDDDQVPLLLRNPFQRTSRGVKGPRRLTGRKGSTTGRTLLARGPMPAQTSAPQKPPGARNSWVGRTLRQRQSRHLAAHSKAVCLQSCGRQS
jgi:hypothetical protein